MSSPWPGGSPGAGHRHGAAAGALVASRLGGSLLGDLPEGLRPADQAEAYAVQRCAHGLLERSGFGPRAGWKIGCTTPVMQEYLGISSPCAGAMFQANIWRGHHRFLVGPPRRLGVECEIAVRVGRDLPPGGAACTEDDVAGAVVSCMAAIEVVEDRYTDYPALGTPTLIADDFFHHSCVLGPEHEDFDPRRLVSCTASMTVNGQEVGHGQGSDIMGEPLQVLAWLARSCAQWGSPLRAGDIVLLGSLVKTHWMAEGDVVSISNRELGEAGASFAGRDGTPAPTGGK